MPVTVNMYMRTGSSQESVIKIIMMIANDIQAANANLPGKLKVLNMTTSIMMPGTIHAHTHTLQFTPKPGSAGNDNYVDYNAQRCKGMAAFAGRKSKNHATLTIGICPQ